MLYHNEPGTYILERDETSQLLNNTESLQDIRLIGLVLQFHYKYYLLDWLS